MSNIANKTLSSSRLKELRKILNIRNKEREARKIALIANQKKTEDLENQLKRIAEAGKKLKSSSLHEAREIEHEELEDQLKRKSIIDVDDRLKFVNESRKKHNNHQKILEDLENQLKEKGIIVLILRSIRLYQIRRAMAAQLSRIASTG